MPPRQYSRIVEFEEGGGTCQKWQVFISVVFMSCRKPTEWNGEAGDGKTCQGGKNKELYSTYSSNKIPSSITIPSEYQVLMN
jgi:hypothetical protein